MLEIASGISGRKKRCALHYSPLGHWKSHLVLDCRWTEVRQRGSRWRAHGTYLQLIAVWKGSSPPLHLPTPRGMLVGDAACRHNEGEDLPPSETCSLSAPTEGLSDEVGKVGDTWQMVILRLQVCRSNCFCNKYQT